MGLVFAWVVFLLLSISLSGWICAIMHITSSSRSGPRSIRKSQKTSPFSSGDSDLSEIELRSSSVAEENCELILSNVASEPWPESEINPEPPCASELHATLGILSALQSTGESYSPSHSSPFDLRQRPPGSRNERSPKLWPDAPTCAVCRSASGREITSPDRGEFLQLRRNVLARIDGFRATPTLVRDRFNSLISKINRKKSVSVFLFWYSPKLSEIPVFGWISFFFNSLFYLRQVNSSLFFFMNG